MVSSWKKIDFVSSRTSNVLVVATSFADQSRSAFLAMALQFSCLTATNLVLMSLAVSPEIVV